MKRLVAIIMLFLSARLAFSAESYTANIYVTNTPAHNATLVVNGDTRTWKTNASTVTHIVLNPAGSNNENSTNLFSNIAAQPFVGPLHLRQPGANQIRLIGGAGQALAVTVAAAWGYATITTNTVTQAQSVRVPMSSEPATVATNNASQIVTGLNAYSTNRFLYVVMPTGTATNLAIGFPWLSWSVVNGTYTLSTNAVKIPMGNTDNNASGLTNFSANIVQTNSSSYLNIQTNQAQYVTAVITNGLPTAVYVDAQVAGRVSTNDAAYLNAVTNGQDSADLAYSLSGRRLSYTILPGTPLAKLKINNLVDGTNLSTLSGLIYITNSFPLHTLITNGAPVGYVLTRVAGGVDWQVAPGAAGGEANTISSVGAGTGLVSGKVGVDLQVKSIIPSSGFAVASVTATDVTVQVDATIPRLANNQTFSGSNAFNGRAQFGGSLGYTFSNLTAGATNIIDLTASSSWSFTVTNAATFITSNRWNGATFTLFLTGNFMTNNFVVPSGWHLLSGSLTNALISNKYAIVSGVFKGTADTDCAAAIKVEP